MRHTRSRSALDTRIQLADALGSMGEVELDRPAAACLEVDEEHSVLRREHVARVRLTVQQLFTAAPPDRSSQTSQRPLRAVRGLRRRAPVSACGWSRVAAPESTRSVKCGVERSSSRMPRCNRSSASDVGGWWDSARCDGFVVGPQRDDKAVTLVHAWLCPRLQSGHGTARCDESLSEVDLELRTLMLHRRHTSKDAARHQPQGELVRVVQDDRVLGREIQRRCDHHGCRNGTRHL